MACQPVKWLRIQVVSQPCLHLTEADRAPLSVLDKMLIVVCFLQIELPADNGVQKILEQSRKWAQRASQLSLADTFGTESALRVLDPDKDVPAFLVRADIGWLEGNGQVGIEAGNGLPALLNLIPGGNGGKPAFLLTVGCQVSADTASSQVDDSLVEDTELVESRKEGTDEDILGRKPSFLDTFYETHADSLW
jgi:hypothetical protein